VHALAPSLAARFPQKKKKNIEEEEVRQEAKRPITFEKKSQRLSFSPCTAPIQPIIAGNPAKTARARGGA
jgi:hypothetical protein